MPDTSTSAGDRAEAAERLERLIGSIDGIVWEAEAAPLRFTYVSPQAERILGYAVEHWIDDPGFWASRIHPDDAHWVPAFCAAATAELRAHRFEYRMIAADGRVVRLQDIVNFSQRDGRIYLHGLMIDVTEPHEADRALAVERGRTDLILDSIADGVLVLDAAGDVQRLNRAAEAMLGWQESEVLGRNAHELFRYHQSDGAPYAIGDCPIYRSLGDGGVRRVENEHFFRRDGSSFPVHYVVSGVTDDSGEVTGAVVSFRDVSAWRSEERVRGREAEVLRALAAGSSVETMMAAVIMAIEELCPPVVVSILLLDEDGRRVRDCFGVNLPSSFHDILPDIEIGPLQGSCGAAMHTGQPVLVDDIAADARWADHGALPLSHGFLACSSVPIKGADGSVLGSFGLYYRERRLPSAEDMVLISRFVSLAAVAIERIRDARALHASEERFRELAEKIGEVFWSRSLSGDRIYYVSPAYEQLWGRPVAELYANPRRWMEAILAEDRPGVIGAVTGSMDGHYASEYRIRRPDGSVVWIADRGYPVRGPDGRVDRIVGTARDITTVKAAEAALRERIKELRCLYRTLAITSDPHRSVAETAIEILRILPEAFRHEVATVARMELEGREYRSHEWTEPAVSFRAGIMAGGHDVGFIEVGYSAAAPAGAGLLAEERTMTAAVADYVGRMLDAREMAARLTQSERLRAVGELTGGVAHDFNNLLTVILGNAEILVDALADEPELRNLADMTLTAAQRCAHLTSRLLAFARRQTLAPRSTDVNELVAGMEPLILRTLGDNVDFAIVPDGDLWPALVDPPQLESAILNLCLNARDAMPEGGRLTVETGNAVLDRDYVATQPDLDPGAYVMIAVSDDGCGMDRRTCERAFEPFFTTKEVGKGSGLGLSMIYGFVKQSRGHVRIYSELGQGTTVRLYFPRAEAGVDVVGERPDEAAAGSPVEEHQGRVLLVEDDPLVRAHVARQLEGLGYAVTAATDGHEALTLLARHDDFDLLFTDVMMPGGVSGWQLAEEARRRRPNLPVLFTSGYTEQVMLRQGRLGPDVQLLSKPYRRDELAARVRAALGKDARSG